MPKTERPTQRRVYYTTFQVAKMLGVAPPTIVNYCNSGRIKYHRTAGGSKGANGGHRRILAEDLLRFCETAGYPVADEVRQAAALAPPKLTFVVIVDDDKDFTRVAEDYLTATAGYNVASVHYPFDAGQVIERVRPAVVLLDLHMPDMDGWEVLQKIRQDPLIQRTLVVACTAFRDATIEVRALGERFDAYYEKSGSLARLAEIIDGLIESRGAST